MAQLEARQEGLTESRWCAITRRNDYIQVRQIVDIKHQHYFLRNGVNIANPS